MDLTKTKTWRAVRIWLIGAGCFTAYLIGISLALAFYKPRMSPEQAAEGALAIAAMFWPVSLPLGFALWYPGPFMVAAIVLIGGTVFVVLRIRRRQLADLETERILKDEGL